MNLNGFINQQYYNLLVYSSSTADKISSDTWNFSKDRFLEHTDSATKAKYFPLNSESINEIKKFPTLIFPERQLETQGYIGFITDIYINDENVSVTFKRVKPIDIEDIASNFQKFHLDTKWELDRTHFAIKKGHLIEIIENLFPQYMMIDYSSKIFLSWSKSKSKAYAEIFRDLAINVLGLLSKNIFISSQSISNGEDWWIEIKDALESSEFGIVFVTDENYNNPWLNYESGILQARFQKNSLLPISTTGDAKKILQESVPLTKFQFTNAIDDKRLMSNLLVNIADRMSIDVDKKNIDSKLNNYWTEYYQKIGGNVRPELSNFKQTLRFWLPKAQKSWENDQTVYMRSRIIPESSALRTDESANADIVKNNDDDFSFSFLEIIPGEKNIIQFDNEGKNKYIWDSNITWIPQTQSGTWFVKIVYDHSNKTVYTEYVSTSVNQKDQPEFREYMKKGNTSRQYTIAELDLDSLVVNDSIKSLYFDFQELIARAKNFDE